ncbi:MAG: GIY-YIG nuclease family protein [Pseudomonadales bacterium]|nr:GIY-YIG nuclease family protein [Pseudomonadales bacterium]
MKYIKIGFTRSHPENRLKTLSTASTQDLYFVGFMLGDKPYEKKLHHRFRASHVKNEWFKPKDELLQFISSLDYGTSLL